MYIFCVLKLSERLSQFIRELIKQDSRVKLRSKEKPREVKSGYERATYTGNNRKKETQTISSYMFSF